MNWIKWKIRNVAIWFEQVTSGFIIPDEIYNELSNTNIDKEVRANNAMNFCSENRHKYSGSWAESDFVYLEALARRIKSIGY